MYSGNIVLLTGAVDYLSDGNRVIAVENGHEILGRATGVSLADYDTPDDYELIFK